MKIKFLPILIFAALVALTGCKPKQTTLSGQMFIVTQGAENVKLGDVEILLIEKSQAADFLQKKQAVVETEITDQKHALEVAEKESEIAKADYDSFLSNKPYLTNADYIKIEADFGNLMHEYNVSYDKLRSLPATSDEFEKTEKEIAQTQSDADSLMEKMTRLQDSAKEANAKMFQTAVNNLVTAKSKLKNSPTAEDYFADFSPVIVEKTLTDADGKFSFVYPRNKSLAIFANARRAVPNGTETYCWLVDAPADVESAQIFLSNNNLVFIDPDNYFKLKPKQIVQESPIK